MKEFRRLDEFIENEKDVNEIDKEIQALYV